MSGAQAGSDFGRTAAGEPVRALTLTGGGLVARVLTYGATLQDLRLEGWPAPLVLGSKTLASYEGALHYAGAIVGRFANRIAGGRFTLDGRTHTLPRNDRGLHCLHGGPRGTSARVWRVDDLAPDRLRLALDLADGEMGFPGAMRVAVTYALPGDTLPGAATLEVRIEAETDAPTPCSFAPHSYFNLDDSPDIAAHRLRLAAPRRLPLDATQIPIGAPVPVAGTPFDFRTPRVIGDLALDHPFCLSDTPLPPRPVAWLTGARSGIGLRIDTTEPGLQVYDAAHFAPGLPGLEGRRYGPRAGLALEPQGWPDAPNRPDFPNPILRPGTRYHALTRYRLSRG